MISRRSIVQGLLQGGLVAALAPGASAASWKLVAAAPPQAPLRALIATHANLVGLIADTVLPRTETPSATDVGVVRWIDAVAADYLSDLKRREFFDGLSAIDALSLSLTGSAVTALPAGAVTGVVSALDAACGMKNLTAAERGYGLLKELVIYGYFTSETVQTEVLKIVTVPGRFDPSTSFETSAAK